MEERYTLPEAREAALRERKDRAIKRISETAAFRIFDQYSFRGEGRSSSNGRFCDPKLEGEVEREGFEKFSQGGFPEDDKEWSFGEAVVIGRVLQRAYEYKPKKNVIDTTKWFGLKKVQKEVVDPYQKDRILVRERPMQHAEVVKRGENEPAYGISYSLRFLNIKEVLNEYGIRNTSYTMLTDFYVPKSVADEVYDILKESPDFMRDIVDSMIAGTLNVGSGRYTEWKPDVYNAWKGKKSGRTKMQIARTDDKTAVPLVVEVDR